MTDMIPRLAVVPTHNRPAELARLLEAISPQCDAVFVVDNASTPPVPECWRGGPVPMLRGRRDPETGMFFRPHITVIRDEEQPPNLSRLWNVGLDAAQKLAWADAVEPEPYDVAIFNDDADVPPGWWDIVSGALRAHPTAAVACTPAYAPIPAPVLKTRPDNDLHSRMTPWAFVTRGEAGMRSDERMRWWWFDTDWDFRARQAGGVLTVPGPIVTNTGANSSTVGALAEQAGRDRETFREIWGHNPW